jgi:hypothetical protein
VYRGKRSDDFLALKKMIFDTLSKFEQHFDEEITKDLGSKFDAFETPKNVNRKIVDRSLGNGDLESTRIWKKDSSKKNFKTEINSIL